jgi:hypothetical protein
MLCLLVCLLSGLLLAQTPYYRDTLEVEIGDGAKVLFLAQDAEDFEAIDRYDLNFIFDELWDRRQKGATGIAELSTGQLLRLEDYQPAKDVEEEVVTPSRRSFYFNVSTNVSMGRGMLTFSDPFFFPSDLNNQLILEVLSDFRPALGYEISLGTDLYIKRRNREPFRINTAFGLSNTLYQLDNFRLQRLYVNTLEGPQLSSQEIAQISARNMGVSVDRKISMFQLFLDIVPTFRIAKDKKNRPFTYGVGPKLGMLIRDGGRGKLIVPVPLYIWGNTLINLERQRMQYALVNQFKYRSLHLFLHVYPRAYSTTTSSLINVLGDDFPRVNPSLWTTGVTIGI